MDPSVAAEQRANAVAKLKRAASLPRMKDGRRPPMHGESVSEGERTQTEQKKDDEVLTSPEEKEKVEISSEEKSPVSKPNDVPAKRRSRSRSRSRGSKDLKAKIKALESPNRGNTPLAVDATLDEQITPLRRSPIPDSPSLASPTPSYYMQMQMSQPLMSPTSPFLYPGTSPSTPVPSLEALQSRHLQGLFRSNSAAARMIAMHKLTGGTEPLEPHFSSMGMANGSPLSGSLKLGRNNTVGGERTAARQLLLRRLHDRIEKTDGEQTSGGEEVTAGSTRSRKRRSRRKSGSSTVVDDRDLTSTTSASSPTATPAPLIADLAPPPDPPPGASTPGITVPIITPPIHSGDDLQGTDRMKELDPVQFEYDTPLSRRGVVVEDEDDIPLQTTPPRTNHNLGLPATLSHASAQINPFRVPHSSDAPSTSSTDSNQTNSLQVPVFLSDPGRRSPFRQDIFPKSPFGTPIKERLREDDEERVLYPDSYTSKLRFPWTESSDREISWAAEPVPEMRTQTPVERQLSWVVEPLLETSNSPQPVRDVSWIAEPDLPGRMPVHDEDEDEDEIHDEPATEEEHPLDSTQLEHNDSPRRLAESQILIVEHEISMDETPLSAAPSQSSTITTTTARESDLSSTSALSSSAPLDVPSTISVTRTLSQSESMRGWDETHSGTEIADSPSKRTVDSGSTSTWGRVKNTFTRSGSSAGRRSRTNSTATRDKKDNTESSRESGASLNSGRRESKGDTSGAIAWQLSQTPLTQSPSASASILSLPSVPRGGVSPIPPPSDVDNAKYSDPKLFPFPGMLKLQEESLKGRGRAHSISSPDIVASPSNSSDKPTPSSTSSMSGQSPQLTRDRKLSHQASDSRLLAKYQNLHVPPVSTTPSTASQIDYFNLSPPAHQSPSPANISLKLPTTREGVKKWLNAKKFFSSQASGSSPDLTTPQSTNSPRPPDAWKKPSLSDLLLGRKDGDNIGDWEDMDKPRASTSASVNTVKADFTIKGNGRDGGIFESSPDDTPMTAPKFDPAPPLSPRFDLDVVKASNENPAYDLLSTPMASPADPNSSTTPDPASSVDESPTPSQSSHASAYSVGSSSPHSPIEQDDPSFKSAEILQRLDHILGSDQLNRMWTSTINSPTRRLLLSSPMLQVVNSNTVKDRFLFLFTDLLVIVKPILADRDSLIDNPRPYPPDRKFVVKNVVQLKDIRLNVDRDEDSKKPSATLLSQRPSSIRTFLNEFAENPDIAISRVFNLRGSQDAHSALGRLLVQLPELDKAKLGEYLSRRSSRSSLRAYLDAIGFIGMGIDMALRVFLLSIHIPSGPGHANTLEYLLDTFAGRWYDANAGIVAFDKDLAVVLVRAIVRLNEALHSSMVPERGGVSFSRHFIEAFRRHDPRSLVPDSALERIYTAVRQEKLCQAPNPTHGRPLIPIVLKRTLPSRLIYRRQSEPIVLRIPQIDPQLTIHLHGQDLVFEPSILTFSKNSEASFRVTGTSLGPKSMVMACFGPNAPSYSGLPLSTTLMVERAFMRNTFQIAFMNHAEVKRKYMFSVDDPVIRHEWIGSLKRQIDAASTLPPDIPPPVQSQVYRAAEALSFTVLRDTLLSDDSSPGMWLETSNGSGLHESIQFGLTNGAGASSPPHAQRHQLGLMNGSQVAANGMALLNGLQSPSPRLWTSNELEALCQQNSSIAAVLSFLQAAVPFDSDDEPIKFYQSLQ